jgi:hypothetical protein
MTTLQAIVLLVIFGLIFLTILIAPVLAAIETWRAFHVGAGRKSPVKRLSARDALHLIPLVFGGGSAAYGAGADFDGDSGDSGGGGFDA